MFYRFVNNVWKRTLQGIPHSARTAASAASASAVAILSANQLSSGDKSRLPVASPLFTVNCSAQSVANADYTGCIATSVLPAQPIASLVLSSSSDVNDAASTGTPSPGPAYDTFSAMIEDVFPAICKIEGRVMGQRTGAGSGFVISEDGLIVTNDHVFSALQAVGVNEITVSFDDGRVYHCEAIAADAEADIAIGRIIAPPGTKFQPISLGTSSKMKRGDPVAILGSALGGSIVPTVGVLSGQRYVADDEAMAAVLHSRPDWCLLQVDAAMSSGNSGGPIVNAHGEVVGVAVMVQLSAGGVGSVNFGVAIDQARPIIEQLLHRGRVTRARVGMTIVHVDALMDERERETNGVALLPGGTKYPSGLFITSIKKGSPADQAGLREGDVLLEIDGRPLKRKGDYFNCLGPVFEQNKRLQCKIFRPTVPCTDVARDLKLDGGYGGGLMGPLGGSVYDRVPHHHAQSRRHNHQRGSAGAFGEGKYGKSADVGVGGEITTVLITPEPKEEIVVRPKLRRRGLLGPPGF